MNERMTMQQFRRGALRMWLDSLTAPDGQTFDILRVLAMLSIFTFLLLAAYDVVIAGHEFKMQDFGIGVAAVFAGVGGGLFLKKSSEDPASQVKEASP